MSAYVETRRFPAAISSRVSDLIPAHYRSVRMYHHDDETCSVCGHRSEIAHARRAIRIARREAEVAHVGREV